jgi:hypothetical protein
MNQSSLFQAIDQQQIRELIDDYEFTCQTILAITNIISYNANGKCYQGKKMKTSPANAIQPNTVVTPDMVIEIITDKQEVEYSAVNEIKVDLPMDKKYWLDVAKQLKKYDDELSGWIINNSKQHDIFFTTTPFRGV